jgi:hypothetical protein
MQDTQISRATEREAVVRFIVGETRTKSEHTRAASALPSPIPIPIPLPIAIGSRFLIWKQDPTVLELGRRLVYHEGFVLNGPQDTRIGTNLSGTTPVARTVSGDFIFTIPDSPEADCAHTFAVVRSTLTMYERLRGAPINWAWNVGANKDTISAFPRAGVTANAYYSRTQKALKFFYFTPTGTTAPIYTCRSLDIVAHETGHAILDGLQPGWLTSTATPQTGALHEAFGDITALFVALSQLDQVDAIIAITKANLHAKNFLSALAEQFGSALGQPLGLRNADNDLKLSQVSTEVHALSQVFTGGIYDVLADIFAFEHARQRAAKDPAQVLFEVAQALARNLLRAIVNSTPVNATFVDVVNELLKVVDPNYKPFIKNRFAFREIVATVPLKASARAEAEDRDMLPPAIPEHPSFTSGEHQDRSTCCGTMQLPEYYQSQEAQEEQLEKLQEPGAIIAPNEILAGLMG